MTIKIRKAQPEDWKEIQRLNFEVYEASGEFDFYLDFERPFSEEGIKSYQTDVTDPENCTLIAESDGKSVGYLVGNEKIVEYRRVRIGEISHMGVSPKYRSSGIGSKLVGEFRKWCKEKKIKRIWVSTYAKNQKAVKFYESQGLEHIVLSLEGDV